MFRISKSKLKKIRRKTVITSLYFPLLLLIFIFRTIPLKQVRRFGLFSGKKFYILAKKSRKTALANIERVYGNSLTKIEQETIAKKVFIEILTGFFDYLAYSHVKNKHKYFQLIEVTGNEHLRKAYGRGKGVICLVPHLSSWEFAAITPPMLGYKTSAASKSMKSNLIENLIIKFRESRGMKNITREGSYQALVDVLNQGECLILMTDQDTRVKGVFVDFLGDRAYTPLGASRLLADTEAALVPMTITRKDDGNYRFIIYPEIETIKTDNPSSDLIENTKNQNNIYSKIIRTYPSQWVWMHKRWKTTPEYIAQYQAKKEQKQMCADSVCK